MADDASGFFFLLRIHQHLNNFQRSSSCMYLNTFQSKAIGMQYPRHTINQQDLYNDISFLFFLPFFHFGMCAGISAPSKRYMYFSPFFLFLLWNVYGCKNPHTSFLHPYTFQCGNRKKGERYMYFWDIPAPSPAHVHIPKWKIGKNVREYPLEYYPHCLTIRWARISFLGCITSSLYIFCPRANAQNGYLKMA